MLAARVQHHDAALCLGLGKKLRPVGPFLALLACPRGFGREPCRQGRQNQIASVHVNRWGRKKEIERGLLGVPCSGQPAKVQACCQSASEATLHLGKRQCHDVLCLVHGQQRIPTGDVIPVGMGRLRASTRRSLALQRASGSGWWKAAGVQRCLLFGWSVRSDHPVSPAQSLRFQRGSSGSLSGGSMVVWVPSGWTTPC